MTSTTLIPVFTGTLQDQPTQLCNARDLHTFLQVGRDFSNWIKERIETYGFIDGEDFKLDSPKLANQKSHGGNRRSKDYHLTLDTAKELAMVENNDQGRQARRYFIALEKRLGQAQPAAEPPLALDNHRHITPAQAEEIATLICGLFPGHLERLGAWRRFRANFKIHSYRRLPAHKFDEAITFIESTDARRRNEFGREGGQSSSHLALRDIGPQIDLAALSRQVAEYLMHENRDDSPTICGQTDLTKIEALLNETMEQFNSLPNGLIYQNLHAVMSLLKQGKSKANRLQGVRRLELPQPKSSPQSDLVQFMRELDLPCVEIGLCEIEDIAGCNLAQLPLGDLAEVTAKTLSRRPEHIADIQLVSGWIFAEVNSTDAKRDGVRQQWLDVARRIEDALSS